LRRFAAKWSRRRFKTLVLLGFCNHFPTWLDNAHKKLDRAVLTAYGWDDLIPTLVDGQPANSSTNPAATPSDTPVVIPSGTPDGIPSEVEESHPTQQPSPEEELLARLLALNLERGNDG
jgi:hypothetical protein